MTLKDLLWTALIYLILRYAGSAYSSLTPPLIGLQSEPIASVPTFLTANRDQIPAFKFTYVYFSGFQLFYYILFYFTLYNIILHYMSFLFPGVKQTQTPLVARRLHRVENTCGTNLSEKSLRNVNFVTYSKYGKHFQSHM